MEEAKEEIRARLAIEDVIGQYIELRRAGQNLKGRSPWGVDRTPSFMVSPEKGIWHDFSANKGGDIFSFVMEIEGIGFREALEKLAAMAGVELEKYRGGDVKVAAIKSRAKAALKLAAKFYQACLVKNHSVGEYVFYRRNLNRATVRDFQIGYAPAAGRALKEFLVKKGFSEEEQRAAGLLNRFGGDLFRGRMMVPFIEGGDIIGFTGRIIKDGEPKYLNTPETLLFNKSRFVFGLSQARAAISERGFVVIVEGNMDVISSHQAGVKTAVATSGTAMTEQHLKRLSRLTKDVRLAYDGDAAGVKATERAIDLAGGLGINLSVIFDYRGAKDPDELIQRDPRLWAEAVARYRPAVDWLLEHYEKELDLTSGPGKREWSDIALKVIGYLRDPVEKKHYLEQVARRLDVSVADLLAKKTPDGGRPRRLKKVATSEAAAPAPLRALATELAALMIFGGDLFGDDAAAAPAIATARAKIAKIMDFSVYLGNKSEISTPPDYLAAFSAPKDAAKTAELELVFDTKFSQLSALELSTAVLEKLKRYQQEVIRAETARLTKLLDSISDETAERKILTQIERLNRARAEN